MKFYNICVGMYLMVLPIGNIIYRVEYIDYEEKVVSLLPVSIKHKSSMMVGYFIKRVGKDELKWYTLCSDHCGELNELIN